MRTAISDLDFGSFLIQNREAHSVASGCLGYNHLVRVETELLPCRTFSRQGMPSGSGMSEATLQGGWSGRVARSRQSDPFPS